MPVFSEKIKTLSFICRQRYGQLCDISFDTENTLGITQAKSWWPLVFDQITKLTNY